MHWVITSTLARRRNKRGHRPDHTTMQNSILGRLRDGPAEEPNQTTTPDGVVTSSIEVNQLEERRYSLRAATPFDINVVGLGAFPFPFIECPLAPPSSPPFVQHLEKPCVGIIINVNFLATRSDGAPHPFPFHTESQTPDDHAARHIGQASYPCVRFQAGVRWECSTS